MKRIFNTPNMLLLGIVVASAGLLYLGLLWNCPEKDHHVAETNDFQSTSSVPA
ncbi:hypothetical protein [Flavobacterium selenitireducens]|uniref:hypothetical protein n=1 Tax=Flavobacterium selenitireducens TaxID=2722704 RepID=UPI00168A6D19|nr:hypothetical protein [Flavobacterium selenitireducens]MBD3582417.1 hypothetical protein [Flavobacterium selenitireducens]